MYTTRPTQPLHLLPMLLFILSLAMVLVSCQRDDTVAPSSSSTGQQGDDNGGNGNDDPPGDDNGGGN